MWIKKGLRLGKRAINFMSTPSGSGRTYGFAAGLVQINQVRSRLFDDRMPGKVGVTHIERPRREHPTMHGGAPTQITQAHGVWRD